MTLRLLIGLTAALGLAGCGDGGNDDATAASSTTDDTGAESSTGEPATEVSFDEFHAAAEAAFCEWQVACHQYGVVERCADVNHLETRLSMQRLAGVGPAESVPIDYMKEAVEVGRIAFDEENAAKCLAYVRGRTCEYEFLHIWTEEELAGRAACEGVFRGRMGRNGPCVAASECAEASVCGFDPNCGPDMCCVGACRVLAQPLAIGESCAGNTPCVPEAYCASDPNTFMPTVCTVAPKVGQQCAGGSCEPGAFCDFNADVPVCRGPKPEGSDCNGDQECEQPGVCLYNDVDYSAKCFRPREEGGKCDPEAYGTTCLRFDNLCDSVAKVCALPPGKGEGCPDYTCAGDFFCSEKQGTRCVPVADAGEGCGYSPNDYDYEYVPCSGDNYCDSESENGTCKTPSGGAGCPVPADPVQG